MDRHIVMNERLFVHICLDAWLLGSPLQGNKFAETIGYLSQYLKTFTDGSIPEDVLLLQRACQHLVTYEGKLSEPGCTSGSEQLKGLAALICDDIGKLKKEGDYLLMPGGWKGLTSGHAIIYEFKLDAAENLLFIINNTGSGLDYHEQYSSTGKELYNPKLTYLIPKEKRGDSAELGRFLLALLTPQVRGPENSRYKARYLYEEVFPKISFLDGKLFIFDNPDRRKWLTAGQISGTCAERSLHSALKEKFSDLDEYRRFIYGFKAYALRDFIGVLRQTKGTIQNRTRKQLRNAIRHHLRILGVDSANDSTSTPLFTLEERTRDLAFFREHKALINDLTEPLPPQAPQEAISANNLVFNPDILFILFTHTAEIEQPSQCDLLLYKPASGTPLLSFMNLLATSSANATRLTAFEQLEAFFLQLPLPSAWKDPLSAYYSEIDSSAKVAEFCDQLTALQTVYFECCDKLIGDTVSLPRMYLVKMSIVAVIDSLNQAYPMDEHRKGFHPMVQEIFETLCGGDEDGMVYTAMHNPIHDARLMRIKQLYPSLESGKLFGRKEIEQNERIINYYNALLGDEPELLEALETLYQERYAEKKDELHQLLRSHRCTALFYLLTHSSELEAKYKPLSDKLMDQRRMEQALSIYCKRLVSGQRMSCLDRNAELMVSKGLFETKLVLKSTWTEHKEVLSLKAPIINHTFTLPKDSPERQAFTLTTSSGRYKPDNECQLLPISLIDQNYTFLRGEQKQALADQVVTATDISNRELVLLRTVPRAQITLTLEHFFTHLKKCARSEACIYLEGNLFQSGLLLKLLKTPQENVFFEQFDGFIAKAIKVDKQLGSLDQTSVFFIHLMYRVNQYLVQDNRDHLPRLTSFFGELSSWIHNTDNKAALASLHQYRFLTGMVLYSCNALDTASRDATLLSYCCMKAYQNDSFTHDTNTTFHILCATQHMKRLLNNVDIPDDDILSIAKLLQLKLDEDVRIASTGQGYEIISASSGSILYTFDPREGLFFKDGLALSALPLNLRTHPIWQQLALEPSETCFTSRNQKAILVESPDILIRFIRVGNDADSFAIQKQFLDDTGQFQWYQLRASSEQQRKKLALPVERSMDFSSQFPEMLRERDCLLWINEKNDLLITDTSQEPRFRSQDEERSNNALLTFRRGQEKCLTYAGDKHAVVCEKNSLITALVNTFEDRKFVLVVQSSDKRDVILPRYGLSCFIPKDSTTLHLDYDGSIFQAADYPAFRHAGIAHLCFQADTKQVCILPIQPFIKTTSQSQHSDYYVLTQDINATIPQQVVKKLTKKEVVDQLWQYSGTEQFMVFKIQGNQPIPQTPAEALYLAYVYLGTQQPEKAWSVLDACDHRLGGIRGTFDELRYIQWIIQAIPYLLNDGDESISNPAIVSCQLRALALLASYLLQGKTIAIPEARSPSYTDNLTYEAHTLEATTDFLNSVSSTIYYCYTQLQRMRRELPVGYTLANSEKKALLQFYYNEVPSQEGKPKAVGALGYEWVQLHFSMLYEEWKILALKSMLTPYEVERKTSIESYIASHEGIAAQRSDLVWVDIDLSLPIDINLNSSVLSADAKRSVDWFQDSLKNLAQHKTKPIETLLSQLHLDTDENFFVINFPVFLWIAVDKDNPHREALDTYCRAVIIAHRHVPLDKQISNIPLLCNILYRVLGASTSLPNNLKNYGGLFLDIHKFEPRPLKVPQLEDTTTDLLMAADEIWQSFPAPQQTITPTIHPETKRQLEDNTLFSTEPYHGFQDHAVNWRMLEKRYRIGDDLATSDEEGAGEIRRQAQEEQKRLALSIFIDSTISSLKQATKQRANTLKHDLEQLETAILVLAEQGPEDKAQNVAWQLEIDAEKRLPPNINRLLRLYFHQDMSLYQLETALSSHQVQVLHGKIGLYLSCSLKHQQCQRVLDKLSLYPEQQMLPLDLFRLGQALFAENLVNIAEEPALAVFQFHEDKLLRPQQKNALGRLLKQTPLGGYAEVIEKITMGGGKSKVLLPMLAQQKANGNNLVAIEVPQALLQTNYVDLKSLSYDLFCQHAYKFEFTRNSDTSAAGLEQRYHDLTDVMVNKGYLVTTGEAIQSVELVYLDILLDQSDTDDEAMFAEWEARVSWAEKLLLLFRHRCDLLIDEVHLGLQQKNKLNYTRGEAGRAPEAVVKHSIALYGFLSHVCVTMSDGRTIQLNEVIGAHLLFKHVPSEHYLAQLSTALVNHVDSPLQPCLKALLLSEKQKQVLVDYLQNKSDTVPDFVLNASPKYRDLILFYKEQVCNILPFTLSQEQNVKYGPSNAPGLSAAQKLISIPYRAKDKPRLGTQHGNYLETINNTIQSMLIMGIPRDLFQSFLEALIAEAKTEDVTGKLASIDETPSAYFLRELTPDNPVMLSQLNLKNIAQIEGLHKDLCKNKALIFEVCRKQVLPEVRTDTDILHSNPYNKVSMVRSCQGLSGTPVNVSTFHPRLCYDDTLTRGDDAYIYSGVQSKSPKLQVVDFDDIDHYLPNIFATYTAEDNIRALIEASPTITNCANIQVARALARYIWKHPSQFHETSETGEPTRIKYILFYNDADKVSAIPVDGNEQSEPIVIGTSTLEVINERLDCQPMSRFTFYDQSHTIGADIKQDENAKAIVTVGSELARYEFNQAILRMRELLEGNQSIDIMLSEELADTSLDALNQKMIQNEASKLLEDNFFACLDIMHDIIRSNCMDHLLQISGPQATHQKHEYLKSVQNFFVDKQVQDVLQQYGGINKSCLTANIFNGLKIRLLERWEALHTSNGVAVSEEEKEALSQRLTEVCEKYLTAGMCPTEHLYQQDNRGREVEVQKEVELSKATELELMREKEQHKAMYNPDREPAFYQKIEDDYFSQSSSYRYRSLTFRSLQSICHSGAAGDRIPTFNVGIRASSNFYNTVKSHSNSIDVFSKSIHGVLFQQDQYGTLACTLLTQEELRQFIEKFDTVFSNMQNTWISTTQHNVLAGSPPTNITSNNQYQEIIEQLRYFNGELDLLMRDSMQWLPEDTERKLRFYQQYIMPIRAADPEALLRLQNLLSSSSKVFQFIAERPQHDFREYDWYSMCPDASDDEIEDFRRVANAFMAVSTSWWADQEIEKKDLIKTYKLPLKAVGYLKRYTRQIAISREIVYSVGKDGIVPGTLIEQAKEFFTISGSDVTTQSFELLRHLFEWLSPMPLDPALRLLDAITENPCLKPGGERVSLTALPNLSSALSIILSDTSGVVHSGRITAMLKFDLDADRLFAVAQHPALERECFAAVMRQAERQGVNAAVLTILLKRADLEEDILRELISNTALSRGHIDIILSKEVSLNLFEQLITLAPLDYDFNIFVRHSRFIEKSSLSTLLLSKPLEESSILTCLESPDIDSIVLQSLVDKNPTQCVLRAIIHHQNTTSDILIHIVQCEQASDYELQEAIASGVSTNIDNIERLISCALQHKNCGPLAIEAAVQHSKDPETLDLIVAALERMGRPINNTTFGKLLARQALNEVHIHNLLSYPMDNISLELMLNRIKQLPQEAEINMLREFLDSVQGLHLDAVRRRIVTHPLATSSDLSMIAAKSNQMSELVLSQIDKIPEQYKLVIYRVVISRPDATPDLLHAVVDHLYSQQLGFRQGANERGEGVYTQYMTEAERVCNIAENPSAKSIAVDSDLLKEIIRHRNVNETVLMAVLSRTSQAQLLEAILEQSYLIENSANKATLYDKIIAHVASSANALINIITQLSADDARLSLIAQHTNANEAVLLATSLKTVRADVMREVVKHIHMVLEPNREAIIQKIVRDPHSTVEDLLASLPYMLNDEPLLTEVCSHPNASEAVLLAVAEKTTSTQTLETLLIHIGRIQPQNREAVYQKIVNKPDISSASLLHIVSDIAADSPLLRDIVLHDKAEDQLLRSVIQKTNQRQLLGLLLEQRQKISRQVQQALFEKIIMDREMPLETLKALPLELTDSALLQLGLHNRADADLKRKVIAALKDPISIQSMWESLAFNQAESFIELFVNNPHTSDDTFIAIADSMTVYTTLKTIHDRIKNERPRHNIAEKPIVKMKLQYQQAFDALKPTLDRLIHWGDKAHPDYNPKYEAAKVAAEALQQHLHNASEEFFSNAVTPETTSSFISACTNAITTAMETLKKHRGIWHNLHPALKAFVGVLATILVLPAVMTAMTEQGYTSTFFATPKTASHRALESLQQVLDSDLSNKPS